MVVLQTVLQSALRRLREVCELGPARTTEGDPDSRGRGERKDRELRRGWVGEGEIGKGRVDVKE